MGSDHPFWDLAVPILQPLLDHRQITFGLNFAYNLCDFVMFSVWIWQGAAKDDSALRQRFLVAFIITWFLGHQCAPGIHPSRPALCH